VLTNHPIGGPVFAGKQTQPWVCATEEAGLGKPLDAQCNVASKVDWLYISTDPSKVGFQPYDPASPPSDVAQTTTDAGVTTPFIVRRERGVIDRGIYQVVVLADPHEAVAPTAPPKAWNRKLYWVFGGDCKPNHSQPSDTTATNQSVLGKGYAMADSGMTVLGKDCNDRTSAESVMMIKERIIQSLGPIRYTMSEGCSGGSMQQHWIVSNYPGLVDGIQAQCSYPDIWQTMQEAEDCHILDHYFLEVSPHLWANVAQQDAVTGYTAQTTCHSLWDGPSPLGYARNWFDPANAAGCSLPAEQVYDAQSNPKGVRCTLQDYMVGVFGRRAKDGFANRPYDNVGVQYGLVALNNGTITPQQFVDLNQKVGGLDIDWNYTPERSVADPPALDVAYAAGLVTYPRAAATVPILDLRGSSNLEIHTDFHSYTMRERLIQATGGYGNQIIWTDGMSLAGDPGKTAAAFTLLDRWLSRIHADKSGLPLAAKVVLNKPADAVDACWIGGRKITDMQKCRAAFPYWADPRIASGGPLADNVLKCQMRPLDKSAYTVTFTDAQWAALQQAFPQGVCDYNRPGASQRPSTPWMTFEAGPGGRPLGPAPASTPLQAGQGSPRPGPAGRALGPAPASTPLQAGDGSPRRCRRTRAVRLRLGRHARRVRSVVVTASGRRVSRQWVRLDRRRRTLTVRIAGTRSVVVRITLHLRGAKPVRSTRRIRRCG
jgi:hypothetical protein